MNNKKRKKLIKKQIYLSNKRTSIIAQINKADIGSLTRRENSLWAIATGIEMQIKTKKAKDKPRPSVNLKGANRWQRRSYPKRFQKHQAYLEKMEQRDKESLEKILKRSQRKERRLYLGARKGIWPKNLLKLNLSPSQKRESLAKLLQNV